MHYSYSIRELQIALSSLVACVLCWQFRDDDKEHSSQFSDGNSEGIGFTFLFTSKSIITLVVSSWCVTLGVLSSCAAGLLSIAFQLMG